MAKYRKKPIVIEAIQWQPGMEHEALCKDPSCASPVVSPHIHTLEGAMHVAPGHWIIKGVAGEFYPCKPDIFEATYELAEPREWDPLCATCTCLCRKVKKPDFKVECKHWKPKDTTISLIEKKAIDTLDGI